MNCPISQPIIGGSSIIRCALFRTREGTNEKASDSAWRFAWAWMLPKGQWRPPAPEDGSFFGTRAGEPFLALSSSAAAAQSDGGLSTAAAALRNSDTWRLSSVLPPGSDPPGDDDCWPEKQDALLLLELSIVSSIAGVGSWLQALHCRSLKKESEALVLCMDECRTRQPIFFKKNYATSFKKYFSLEPLCASISIVNPSFGIVAWVMTAS
jgi:hypothetical protein